MGLVNRVTRHILPLETSTLKRLFVADRYEFKLHLIVSGIGAILVLLVTGLYLIIALYAVYLCLKVLVWRLAKDSPDVVENWRTLSPFTLAIVAEEAVFSAAAIFLFSQGTFFSMATACVMLCGQMLSGIWSYADELILWISVSFVLFFALPALPFAYGIAPISGMELIGSVGIMLLLWAYFSVTAYQNWRLRSRERRARARQIERTRIEAMGQLTGGIAHDFNNLLTAVLGNIELSRLSQDADERDQLLREAQAAGERAARLTSQLLTLSRQSVLRPRPVDVKTVVGTSASMLKEMIPAHTTLQIKIEEGDIPKVMLDPGKLEAVLLGLGLNARDAMPDGGEIAISVAPQPCYSPSRIPRNGHQAFEPCVAIDVEDSGVGINQDILPRVTEPFFTTKSVGEGSGLGLSVAQGFAEQSGGTLEITSTPGKGTRVRLCLPVATEPEVHASENSRVTVL